MNKINFKNASFIKTAIQPKDYPLLRNAKGNLVDEIAVVGRSNVGKSSLLNYLFHRKNLVKTSSSPGKTQAINFFSVDDSLIFVDLPGYGYAKVSQKIRAQWGPMVQQYLEDREQLKLVLFLFDIRRMPNNDDFQLLEWFEYNQIDYALIFTKVDKLTRSQRTQKIQKILKAFDGEEFDFVKCSVTKNIGRHELMNLIMDKCNAKH